MVGVGPPTFPVIPKKGQQQSLLTLQGAVAVALWWMRRFVSGRKYAAKRESRLVTAQVLRPLDSPSGEAKREKFAVKGRTRSGISR